jgi:pilus assembly protein CpaE
VSDAPQGPTPPYVALVIDPDPAWRQRSVQAISAYSATLEAADLEAARETLNSTPANIAVFGPNTAVTVRAHIAPLLRQRPDLGVLLVMDSLDIDGLREAMRAGVREVLPAQTSSEELQQAVGRLTDVVNPLPAHPIAKPESPRRAPVKRDRGRLVMVCSAKGGTGVSSVAVNLAAALADTGRTVTLCDADPVFGDLPLLLGMKTRTELEPGELPKGLKPEEVIEELSLHEPSGVQLFTMYRARMPLNELPRSLVLAVFDGLQAASDIAVIDMPAPLVNVAEYLVAADELFLVAGTDVAALKNLRLAVQLMDRAGLPIDKAWMVLNRIRNIADFEPAGYKQIVGLPVVCALPDSTALLGAAENAEVLVRHSPRDQTARAFTKFAQDLAGRFDQLDAGVNP